MTDKRCRFDFGNKQENDPFLPCKRFRPEKLANSLNRVTSLTIAFQPHSW
jgi:hypothetical protein